MVGVGLVTQNYPVMNDVGWQANAAIAADR
jgi:hypothetical protein